MADETMVAPPQRAETTGIGERLDTEKQALDRSLGEASEAVAAEAGALRDQAADRIGQEAGAIKEEAAAGLAAFSDALRTASEELSGKKLGFAGDMVSQAADGLGGLARSLDGKSPAEMLDAVRSFGRQNPIGFIAGSVLAGFAVGRIAAAAPAGGASPAPRQPDGAPAPYRTGGDVP